MYSVCCSVIPVRCYSRRHCGDVWFGCCRAAVLVSSAKTKQLSSRGFVDIQHKGWSNSFCWLAVHVSSIKRHENTWLQHTNRLCIALRIICGLSTTFIHDSAKQLPDISLALGVSTLLCIHGVCMHTVLSNNDVFSKLVLFCHPNFLSSFWEEGGERFGSRTRDNAPIKPQTVSWRRRGRRMCTSTSWTLSSTLSWWRIRPQCNEILSFTGIWG